MLRRIRSAMGQRDAAHLLPGVLEFDDAYFWGPTAPLHPDRPIRSDGYRSYIPALKDYIHEHKGYVLNSGVLHCLYIVVSDAKAFILGTYHGLPKDHLQSYLDKFAFRFSRTFLAPCCPSGSSSSWLVPRWLTKRDNHIV